MWFSAIKLALNAGTHIYKKKQETKMAMADAQHMHAARMASGEEQYQGKLFRSPSVRLEGRGSFDNFKYAHSGARLGGYIGRSNCYG